MSVDDALPGREVAYEPPPSWPFRADPRVTIGQVGVVESYDGRVVFVDYGAFTIAAYPDTLTLVES